MPMKTPCPQGSMADLSVLPSVEALLTTPEAQSLSERCSGEWVKSSARAAIEELRSEIRSGEVICSDRAGAVSTCLALMRESVEGRLRPSLRRVINATGIVLHTGLGRAPLPRAALRQVLEVGGGYCNLELDLENGDRGDRTSHVERLLCDLSGAEAAAVVNNNAAAVLLCLNTLAFGKEAVVSRGQLIEIGGSFRIPDVMARSGAQMVEVGTTNRTHLRDYEEAVGERTGVLLSVHPSNFRVRGFTSEVGLEDLAALGRRTGVAVVHDLGGGAIVDLRSYGLPYEPLVGDSVRAGVDVVTFSGDKVLGGPQAGVVVGRRKPVEAMRRNPLMRALRCDKLTYAALEATLRLHLNPRRLVREHPTLRMLTDTPGTLRRRARRILKGLGGLEDRLAIQVEDSTGYAGSGTLPLEEIPSVAVFLQPKEASATGLARRLRTGEPPVVGYVREGRVCLDVRTVRDDEVGRLVEGVRAAASIQG